MKYNRSIPIIAFLYVIVTYSSSQYKGVVWHKGNKKWMTTVCWNNTQIKGGEYRDELDAAKRVNQLCDELDIQRKNPEVSAEPHPKVTYSTSLYKGVTWHKQHKKWATNVYWNKKQFQGGEYRDELNAAKRVNQLCDELGIQRKNSEVDANAKITYSTSQLNKKLTYSASQYKGVSWNNFRKWSASVYCNNEKYHGGCYSDEVDAAKRVNQLCEELGIKRKNPGVGTMPNTKITYSTSQYQGVSWNTHAKKWLASIYCGNIKYQGGYYKNELNAAKRVNQLCEKLGMAKKNSEVDALPQTEKKNVGTSQYKWVYWTKDRKRWKAEIKIKDKHKTSYHVNEIDAARRVNKWCDEFGIKQKNPDVDSNSNVEQECKTLPKFEHFMKMLDKNSDPTALTIKKTLTAAIRHNEEITTAEINLQMKNGESALSIAAKYGFSNAVKFLILKGAEKENFTNNLQTPLSLAVCHNHFKVVQVLFENWISPNAHKEPYLHLSPIFNVKSREIVQLLVDNDAITNDIYNGKNQSPLTVACQNGFLDVVEFFLDDGLDINHLDSDNKTPLIYAQTNKHHDVVNLLILKGEHNNTID